MSTTETAPPAPPKPFADRLREAIATNEWVLASIPDNKLAAQRVVRSKLQLDPPPEMLQLLCRLAHTPPTDPELDTMLRRQLALRWLADKELSELLEAPQIDPVALRTNSMNLLEIQRAGKTLAQSLQEALARPELQQREIWQAAAELLSLPADGIAAAIAIAPRLEQLATAARKGTLEQMAPTLLPSEARLIAAASGVGVASHSEESSESTPSRVMIDALALRSMMQDELAAWKAGTQSTNSEKNLQRCKIAYHVLAERLQQHQNNALASGGSEFATHLSKVQRGLFNTYTKLAPAIRGEAPPRTEVGAQPDESRDQQEAVLLERCSAADVAVEARKAEQPSQEELMLDALKNVGRESDAPAANLGQARLRQQRKRTQSLGAVAALLIVTAVGLQIFLRSSGGGAGEIHASPTDFAGAPVAMTRIYTIGPLMYAEISTWTWDELTDGERLSKLDELGQIAADRGFGAIFLVDESRQELGSWSRAHGSKLHEGELGTPPRPGPAQEAADEPSTAG